MSEKISQGRYGYDVDDTLVRRSRLVRFFGAVAGRSSLSSHSTPGYTVDTLPDLNHTPADVVKGKGLNFRMHMGRIAIPGVPEKLQARAAQGAEQFAISGRFSTASWHEGTAAQLTREGYPITPDRVILTPLGEKGRVSKAVAIKNLRLSRFADDDLGTQLFLSFVHPDVEFDWIQYGLTNTHVDKVVLAARPNLRTVPINEWMNSQS
jgi:hypothetical protein